ncbi:MAG: LysE family transporter [Planctomycetota bacterium]
MIWLRERAIVSPASRAAYWLRRNPDRSTYALIETLAIVAPLMFSPGPANLAAFAMALRSGFAPSVPFLVGIATIYAAMAGLAAAVGSQLIGPGTSLQTAWQVLGGLFIAYLGWRLTLTMRIGSVLVVAPGYGNGVVLQLLNPKYPTVVLAVLANRANEPPFATATIIAGVGLIGLVVYASLGTTTRHWGRSEVKGHRIDRAFGWLLVATGFWLAARGSRDLEWLKAKAEDQSGLILRKSG